MDKKQTILITGGAGFTGSHLVLHMASHYAHYHIVNLDALTYAADVSLLDAVSGFDNYTFVQGDIRDRNFIQELFDTYGFDHVIHLAAESHVDNSIVNPAVFAETNVLGTLNLLEAAKTQWEGTMAEHRFYHISTDEVFGSLGDRGFFSETTPYDPRSPYSASKASSDHFVRAYYHTYQLPVLISNCSNNYGPHQHKEKLIPLFIKNIIEGKNLPVYGAGTNIRDWLYVKDHVQAMDAIFHRGTPGETYAIGGNNELRNIDLVRLLIQYTDDLLGNPKGTSESLITYVTDRKGHDFRYAIDATKLKDKLQWEPKANFEEALKETIVWYLGKYKS